MSKAFALILRYGPLVAAALVGASNAVPGAADAMRSLVDLLALVGVQPDQTLAADVASVISGLLLLIGAARKVYSKIRARYSPPTP